MTTGPMDGRNARRKEQTRAALLRAAQELLIDGHAQEASIKTITTLADVGFGSFFNHFASKTELFDVVLSDAAERYEGWLDARLAAVTDPLRRLALSIRLTGRLHESHPEEARLLTGQFTVPHAGKHPLADRTRAEIVAATSAMSTDVARSPSTVIAATGAIAAVLATSATLPEDERAVLADSLAADVLRLLGADGADIAGLVDEPLP